MAIHNRFTSILVYAHWKELQLPILMGTLSSTSVRGKEVFSFEYETNWLNNVQALQRNRIF
jgi:serine/threonine-protein kinase HipA